MATGGSLLNEILLLEFVGVAAVDSAAYQHVIYIPMYQLTLEQVMPPLAPSDDMR